MENAADRTAALLDMRLLRLFDLLYTTRNVTRAAELLGQAQPTVSIWLNRLRRELKDPLFVRTPAGMEPTPRADALIGTARTAIELLQRLSEPEQEFHPATDARRFRICMTDASHLTLLPRLLGHIREAAPQLRIEAVPIDQRTASRLQSGEADLALGLLPELEGSFYQQTLYAQDWVCVVNPRHWGIRDGLALAEYEEAGHVAVVSGTGHRLLDAAVAAARLNRRIILELPGFLGLAAAVLATDLVATLPRHTAETLAKANGLAVHPCPFAIPSFTVKQHWHARYHHDAGSRWLRGVCAMLFQQRAG